jgi:hypothetical protein
VLTATSRYAGLEVLVLELEPGRAIPYLSRRFVPSSTSLPLLQETTTTQGDRLDLIATRTIGDPEQYWRICDANDAMNPVDLVSEPGRRLRVPVPYPQGISSSLPIATAPYALPAGLPALPPGGQS